MRPSRPNCVTACQEAANVCTRSCNEKTGVSVEGCQISCSKRYYQPCFRRCLETNEVPVVDPYEPPAKAPEPEPKRSRR